MPPAPAGTQNANCKHQAKRSVSKRTKRTVHRTSSDRCGTSGKKAAVLLNLRVRRINTSNMCNRFFEPPFGYSHAGSGRIFAGFPSAKGGLPFWGHQKEAKAPQPSADCGRPKHLLPVSWLCQLPQQEPLHGATKIRGIRLQMHVIILKI